MLASWGLHEWLDVLDIALKTIISIGVGVVGLLAYNVNKNKFKLDLYNRRLNLYTSLLEYHYALMLDIKDEAQLNELKSAFRSNSIEAIFLFGVDSEVSNIATNYAVESNKNDRDIDKLHTIFKDMTKALMPWLDFSKINKPSTQKLRQLKKKAMLL